MTATSQTLNFSKAAKHLARGLLTPDNTSACSSIFNIEQIVLLHLKAQHFTHKSNHKVYRDCLEFSFFPVPLSYKISISHSPISSAWSKKRASKRILEKPFGERASFIHHFSTIYKTGKYWLKILENIHVSLTEWKKGLKDHESFLWRDGRK